MPLLLPLLAINRRLRSLSHGQWALLMLCALLVLHVQPALAVEPVTTISIGTITTIIGACITLLKILFDMARLIACWTIALVIALWVFINVGALAKNFGLLDLINMMIGGTENCQLGERYD